MLTCGFNLLHAAPFLNSKDQFHRREKNPNNSKIQYSANHHLNINHSEDSSVQIERGLDKPNNIGATHKLPAGRWTRSLGLQLGLFASETGVQERK